MKSRSPAPGGKKSALGGKKSELQELPSIDSLPDGDRTFFVGGWCIEGSFTNAISRIALETKPHDKDASAEEPMQRVAKELEGGRFVSALEQPEAVTEFTKTNVVILPGLSTTPAADSSNAPFFVAELTHGMFISGLAPSAMEQATSDFNARHPLEEADRPHGDGAEEEDGNNGEENESPSTAYSSRPRPRYEVTYRNPNAAGDEDGGDEEMDGEEEVDEDGNPIQPPTQEEVEDMIAKMRKKGSAVSAAEIAQFLTTVQGALTLNDSLKTNADPQRLKDTRHKSAASPAGGGGAGGYAKPKRPTLYRRGLRAVNPEDLVLVKDSVLFKGIRPLVAVEPEEVTATRVASALGVATINPVDRSGKPRRKTDEEKQRETEAAALLEQASKEAALAEEERLNAFALPDRWPTVYISNLAFCSPIKIQGAHLRFYRCNFSGVGFADCVVNNNNSTGDSKFLVSIDQYCRVEFCECTFEQPAHTAIYAYPTAELFLSDCFFSRFASPTSIDDVLRLAVLPPHMSPLPTPGEGSIAIHADAARLTVTRCHFEGFGNAIITRNSFNVLGRMLINGEEDTSPSPSAGEGGEGYGVSSEPNDEGHLSVRLRPTLSNVTDSVFLNNSCSSITFIDAKRIGVNKCIINDDACGGYYSIQVTGSAACTPQIMRCNIHGRLLIAKGCRPFLYRNIGKVQVVDKNQSEASYMSPKY